MGLQQISDSLRRSGCRQARQALPDATGEQLCHELAHDLSASETLTDNAYPVPIRGISTAAIIVMLACLIGYLLTPGLMAVVSERQRLADPLRAFSEERQPEKLLAELQRKIRATPQDSVLWATLGEYYLYRNAWPDALQAWRQALKLRGENAQLYAALATTLYYQAGQSITPEARRMIDKALVLDANEVTALMLLAADAFMHADYSRALKIWQQLLDSENPRLNRAQVIEAINMAKLLQNQSK